MFGQRECSNCVTSTPSQKYAWQATKFPQWPDLDNRPPLPTPAALIGQHDSLHADVSQHYHPSVSPPPISLLVCIPDCHTCEFQILAFQVAFAEGWPCFVSSQPMTWVSRDFPADKNSNVFCMRKERLIGSKDWSSSKKGQRTIVHLVMTKIPGAYISAVTHMKCA